jgi:hypothetical protein
MQEVIIIIIYTPLVRLRKYGTVKVKKSLYRAGQALRVPRFQDNRHMKVVRLSAQSTGHLYAPGSIPGTHFC